MRNTNFRTIGEYFGLEKTFVIPNYQRGYKWAVPDPKKDNKSSVEELMDRLINSFKDDPDAEYFLQGISVSESENEIILIDGQQRTTTLYLILWCLDQKNINGIELIYNVRQDSRNFISSLKGNHNPELAITEEDIQDIYYFKKAIEIINRKIKEKKIDSEHERELFRDYILEKVTVLYIVIDETKATKTFTMMNGQKATMKDEELIKSELLRMISLPEKLDTKTNTSIDDNLNQLKEIIAKDWEINNLRSKYAREWDKWLYWWNKKDVMEYFGSENPMGLLVRYYFEINKPIDNIKKASKSFSFESFKKEFLKSKKSTKDTFSGLRKLQKTFEDLYNDYWSYNYLGIILRVKRDDERASALKYFLPKANDLENTGNSKVIIQEYAQWSLVDATHLEIVEGKTIDKENKTTKITFDKASNVLNILSGKYVYAIENENSADSDTTNGAVEHAYRQLLRINIEEDNKIERKFDFSIWGNRSLEHIHPKSKRKELTFDPLKDQSIHCIGNLVLLYGKNNSEFGAKDVTDKKKVFFDIHKEFKSRHLLHTVSTFAIDGWGVVEIENAKNNFITNFKTQYEIN